MATFLSDVERSIVKLVVERFLQENKATPRKELVAGFKPQGLEAVNHLVNLNILRQLDSDDNLPCAIAFHYHADHNILQLAKTSLEAMIPVLQGLYESSSHTGMVSTTAVDVHVSRIRFHYAAEQHTRLALYLSHEMAFISGWSWDKKDPQTFRINERVMSIDPAVAWDHYVQRESKRLEQIYRAEIRQKFLAGIFNLVSGRTDRTVTPMQSNELVSGLGISHEDFALLMRSFLSEELIQRRHASEAFTLTRKGVAEIQGKNVPFAFEEPEAMAEPPGGHRQNEDANQLLVFISHSSKDADLALALIELLKAGLGILSNQIRCSSVDGYRLPVGVNTEAQLREEVNAAEVVIGLITPSSLASAFVMFELGARWGANQFLAPLLAGVKPSELTGPLALLNCLSGSSEAQLHQLLDDVSTKLGLRLQNAASYLRYISEVKRLVDGVAASRVGTSGTAVVEPKVEIPKASSLSLTVVGTPPSPQKLKVKCSHVVKAIRLDYLLSTGACIASDNLNLEGESFDVPIEDQQVLKVWNTPRSDRNWSDHSGPAKLRIILIVNGIETPYVLPVQMDSYHHANTVYRKLAGAEMF